MTEHDMYTYRDGYREGVVFLFTNADGQVLLEYRREGDVESPFFPNGSVEKKDQEYSGNHLWSSVMREISEELGDVFPINVSHLGVVVAEPIKVIFDVFHVSRWKGVIPSHTTEDGKPFGRLEWMSKSDALKAIPYKTGEDVLNLLNMAEK